jgi:hypothetical protein
MRRFFCNQLQRLLQDAVLFKNLKVVKFCPLGQAMFLGANLRQRKTTLLHKVSTAAEVFISIVSF